ncbi:flagellar motor protein MotB [Silicimonas sp. MF1-12-2]|uniref:flagellar motor protein MotB n=1 Tax=Silicimonas sp. MF1-12-2 TaxID=3384793 RepID=UPI0039B682DE
MSAQPVAPIIVKRKKIIAGGHHGGAWKVAYADFVTAMMAFFLLMWLLGATNEKQRKGIADYFNPTIPVNKVSGGGDGAFGGDSIFSENTLARNGTGTGVIATNENAEESSDEDDARSGAQEKDKLAELEEMLSAKAGESMVSDLLMRHIVTRLTDEGLIVEIFDLPDAPLFAGRSDPTDVLRDVVASIAEVFRLAPNPIAVQGHVAAVPVVSRENPVWDLSSERADAVRLLLVQASLDDDRMQRVTGYADRQQVSENPLSVRNNRIEIVLLRSRL